MASGTGLFLSAFVSNTPGIVSASDTRCHCDEFSHPLLKNKKKERKKAVSGNASICLGTVAAMMMMVVMKITAEACVCKGACEAGTHKGVWRTGVDREDELKIDS